MVDNGYVYVLMNSSMKDLVKIGKTTKTSEERAKELSSSTGVPTPFIVAYDCYFESCSDAEQYVHNFLETQGYRVSSRREFFEIPIKDAIDSVMKAKEHFGEFKPTSDILNDTLNIEEEVEKYIPDEDPVVYEVKSKADEFYHGYSEELQDYDEALKYYLKAIKLGSVEAYRDVGDMYDSGTGVKKNSHTALKYYKDGAKKGNIDCYSCMAMVFKSINDFEDVDSITQKHNIGNAIKSWDNYFENIGDMLNYVSAGEYIKFIVLYGDELKHLDKLVAVKDEVIEYIKESNDIFKDGQMYSLEQQFITKVENAITEAEREINGVVDKVTEKETEVEINEKIKKPSLFKRIFG